MDDQQIGNLRVKDGVIQIKVNGRWRRADRSKIEEVLWAALSHTDQRIKSLEYAINDMRGYHD